MAAKIYLPSKHRPTPDSLEPTNVDSITGLLGALSNSEYRAVCISVKGTRSVTSTAAKSRRPHAQW